MTDAEFIEAALANPNNAAILARLPELGVRDCWLVSGALFQTVWNLRTLRMPTHGIRDYDIFYFDPDTRPEAEAAAAARARALFADLPITVELRNQARVHLWYPEKFGMPYPPLSRSWDAIDRFLSRNSQVGINAVGEIYAPRGLGDVAQMIVRPNRAANFSETHFWEKARRWQSVWPEITILAQ
jgi:hypothetical protein